MAGFGVERGGGGGGYGRDLAEFITMASGNQSAYSGMPRPPVQQPPQQQHGFNAGSAVGRSGHRKAPAGHKLCDKCGEASPVRYPNCKDCNEPFPMGIRKQKRIKAAEQAQMKEQARQVHYQQHPQQHPQQQHSQQQHPQQQQQQHPQQQQQHPQQQQFMPQQPLLSGFPVPLTPNYPMQLVRQPTPTRPAGMTPFNQHHGTPSSGGGDTGPLVVFPPSTDRLSVGNDADDDQSIPSLQSLPSDESPKQAQSSPPDVRQLSLTNGKQILFFVHNDTAHLSFPDLQSMMPQNLRQVLEKILTTMDFSPDDAKRSEVLLLASRKVVSDTETSVQLYPASDVQKMFTILNLPVPDFILRAAQGEFPQERVDMSEFQAEEVASLTASPWMPPLFARDKKEPPNSLALEGHPLSADSHFVSPSLPSRGVSSAYHAHDGRITSAAFKESRIGGEISYSPLQWGSETLSVLYPKNREPYVCITELNRKLLQVGTKKCQQRRYSLGIDSIPTTAEQVQQLKLLGSLSDKVVYTRLLRLREACKLSESFGLLVPDNVNNEWRKYLQFSKVQPNEQAFEVDDLPSFSGSHDHLDSPTAVMMVDDGLDAEEPIEDDVKELQDGNFYHPDFINLDDDNCSEEGIMKQFRWNGRIYTTFSTRHNIHYLTLAELYDHFLQPKGVTKVNMTYRMRKLNLRTIRSSSWVRLRMIILGSHSPHIPVCCLLQMEECVKLLKCFHIQLPTILKKVFLIGNKKIYKHKLVCQEPDSLFVKVPRVHCKQFPPVKEPVNQFRMDVMEHKHVTQQGNPGGLIGSQIVRDAQGAARRCPHCKHLTPVVKKRCQNCKAFLVGLPCPSCGILNHNRSSYCWKCNSPLEFRETASATSPRKQHIIGSKVQMAQSVSAVYTDSDDGSNDEGRPTSGHHKNHSSSTAQPSRVTAFKTPPSGDGSKAQMGIRMCGECGQANSNKSKKCYRCSKPLIGRPCLSCGRPNHSHSVQCWKCGSSIANPLKANRDTPATSGTVGRYKKSRQLVHSQIRRRNAAQSSLLVDLERNRAQTFCIRCHSFRCSGRFRCGRCGDVFHTKPAFDNEPDEEEATPSGEGKSGVASAMSTCSPHQSQEDTPRVASSDKEEQGKSPDAQPRDSSPSQQDGQQQQQHGRKLEDHVEVTPPPDSVMLTFGKAVYGSGVGRKIVDMLEVDEKEMGQQLPTSEQQYKDAKSLHDRFRYKHRSELNRIQDRQATLDGLIARSDLLVSKLHKLSSKESSSLVLLKELPSSYQTLKKEIKHKAELLAALDRHLIGPLALSAMELDLNERDNLISAIETTLNDEQREAGEVSVTSPVTNGAPDAPLLPDDSQPLMDQDRRPQNGLQDEKVDEPQERLAVAVDESMEVDSKVPDSSKVMQQDMEVEGAGQQEPATEEQTPEAEGQGTELLSSSVPGSTAEASTQQADHSSVDAEMETDNAEMKAPSADLSGAEAGIEAPTTESEASNAETKSAAAAVKIVRTVVEATQVKSLPAEVDASSTESVASKAEVETTTTEAEPHSIQAAAPDLEGPDKEVERVLQENAAEMLPLQNYTNSPDIVSQQANASSAQEENEKEQSEAAVCSTKAAMPDVEQHAEESTAVRVDGEADQKVCETPEVSPASDGVSSPLGLESPKSTLNDPSLVPIRGRRRSSLRDQGTEVHGEDSPPPSKVRKLSTDAFPKASTVEDSEVSAHEEDLHSDQVSAPEVHKEMPRTENMDGVEGEGEREQPVDSVQKDDRVAYSPGSEQGGASPMDASLSVDDTVEEGMSQSPGKQEEELSDKGSTSDISMALPLVKSPAEEAKSLAEAAKSPTEEAKSPKVETKSLAEAAKSPTVVAKSPTEEAKSPTEEAKSLTEEAKSPTVAAKSPTEEAKSPIATLSSPTASGASSGQVSGPVVAELASPQSIKSPAYYTRKRSRSADVPVSGVDSSVGSKRRHSESSNSGIRNPVGSTMPSQSTSKPLLEGEVHDATGQLDHETEMDVSGSSPPPEAEPLKAEDYHSPVAAEPFSPVSSTEGSSSLAADTDVNRRADAIGLVQEDSSQNETEVNSEGTGEREDEVIPLAPKSPEEAVDRSFVESTDGTLLSETYTEVDRVLSPIMEEESQDLLESDVEEQELDEAVAQETNTTDADRSSAPAVCSVKEPGDVDPSTSLSSEQQLVDDSTAQRIERRSSSFESKDCSVTKEASPVPSEDEPVPPGTEEDAVEEAEYATCPLSSPRGQKQSGSEFDSQELAEVQMDTSTSEMAPSGDHEEVRMDDGSHECVPGEDLSDNEVDSSTMVDEMETEECATDVIQQQTKVHGPMSEEPSSANVDSCDAINAEAATPGTEREEDIAGEPKKRLDSEEGSSLENSEVLSTPTQSVTSLTEPSVSATELVCSPEEAVATHAEPLTPPRLAMASPTEHITSTEPVTSPKEPITPPEEHVTSPEEPITSPKEHVTSPKDPVTSPEEPITSPEEHVTSPKEPVTSPEEPITSPKEPITPPKEPVPSPKEPVTSPEEPVTSPKEPISFPMEPNTSPKEPVTSPEEPVTSPKQPVTSPVELITTPAEDSTTPREPATAFTESSTSSSASEQATSHSQLPTAGVLDEGESPKGLESPVDVSPLEESLLDDLLDETGQVTQGGSEEVHELQPSDISLLDDDESAEQQLAEPSACVERSEDSSDRNAESEQQEADYEEVGEEIEQSVANDPGAKVTNEEEGKKDTAGEEESVGFGCSSKALDPSTSEQKHEDEEAVGSDRETDGSSAKIPTAQVPEASNPDQSESKEVGESSENSAIRGLVAYGDSGSSSEDDDLEESAHSNPPTQSAVGVQPETGEPLHEGSRGNVAEEAERLTSSGSQEAAQKSEESPSNEATSARNGQEDMDTSTVEEEEDCSEEMDLS